MSDYAVSHALLKISAALTAIIHRSAPAPPAEVIAAFALTLTLEGLDYLSQNARAYAPDNVTSCEVSPTLPDGKLTGNLYVVTTTPDGRAAQGLKAALMDTLLMDWERPDAGLRREWSELLGQLTPDTSRGDATVLVRQLLEGDCGVPLRYRARLSSVMLSSTTPEERAHREAALLQEFPSVGMRSVQGTTGQSTQEINQALAQRPFRRA